MPAITRTAPRRMAMLTESREAMNLRLVAAKPCNCILIVATLRRQPISAAQTHIRRHPEERALGASRGWPQRLWPSSRRRAMRAPQDDGDAHCSMPADVSRWREPRVYGNLPRIRIKLTARRRSRSRRDFDDDGLGLERILRPAAERGALGRRRGHLALVLSAARPDPGRRRDRVRRRRRGPLPRRHDLAGDGLAGAAAAVPAGAGRQRVHRGLRHR